MEQKIPLVVVAGPTASGKTAAGVFLAQQLNGEVVSADSMQIYRHLTVGTAKPTPQEMQGIPHHLIDFLEPGQSFSVAEYVQLARQAIQEIVQRGKLPVLVGGTGLYISSLVDNIQFSESQGDPKLREQLRQYAQENGPQALWERLQAVDSQAAQRIHPNNVGRVARALEVYQTTGKTISEHNRETKLLPPRYHALTIGLNFRERAHLWERIDRRVDQMAADGLEEEVRRLLSSGLPRTCTAMQAIGYKEFTAALDGEMSWEEALELVKLRTRQYAKRQLTWFRRSPDTHWLLWEEHPNFGNARQHSTELLREFGVG